MRPARKKVSTPKKKVSTTKKKVFAKKRVPTAKKKVPTAKKKVSTYKKKLNSFLCRMMFWRSPGLWEPKVCVTQHLYAARNYEEVTYVRFMFRE